MPDFSKYTSCAGNRPSVVVASGLRKTLNAATMAKEAAGTHLAGLTLEACVAFASPAVGTVSHIKTSTFGVGLAREVRGIL